MFSFLKKLFGKKETKDKQSSSNASQHSTGNQQQLNLQNKQSIPQDKQNISNVNSTQSTSSTVSTSTSTSLQAIQHTQTELSIPESEQELLSWKQLLERLKEHPFSQMKIINYQLLTLIYQTLNQINEKLDKIELLDEIYWLLRKDKELKKLTSRDIEVLKVLLEHGELTAEEVAKKLNVSRSTASLRLNKLFAVGYLGKRVKDRKVYFYIKDPNEIKKIIESNQ